jgi:hypothetical protein
MFESLADMLENALTLKNCPFCGSAAMVHQSKKHKKFPFYVKCTNVSCGCKTERWNTVLGAKGAWNRRAENGSDNG